MGMVYREIKQAVIDIEKLFSVLSRNPEIKDVPGAQPLVVTGADRRGERSAKPGAAAGRRPPDDACGGGVTLSPVPTLA